IENNGRKSIMTGPETPNSQSSSQGPSPKYEQVSHAISSPTAPVAHRNPSLDRLSRDTNESSPLLEPRRVGDEEDIRSLNGDTVLSKTYSDSQETKSVWYLIILTISIGGYSHRSNASCN